ncbi:histone acetyltransferase [Dissophora globulifera]|uniref:histone acetyltransferase n=1 Tax=Dissophora globulifera TaxID=979702 RepID=A0A9P6USA1_9FUNG|nr:histone acetyltransferase [Dissophora globulifera]
MDQPQELEEKSLLQQQQQQQSSPPGDENRHEELDERPTEAANGNDVSHSTSPYNGLNYPPAEREVDKLSMSERMMKIGRSCPCDAPASEEDMAATSEEGQGKCTCQGWKPKPPGMVGRVDTCACGHKLSFHGGPWTGEEFERRLRAAFRRDELLQDKGKLLDFTYDDEDIASLRKQIVPRASTESQDEAPSQNGTHEATNDVTNGDVQYHQLNSMEDESDSSHAMDMDTSEGASKHAQADASENDNVDRESKRIKIEVDDNQDSAQQPSKTDTAAAEPNGEYAADVDPSSGYATTQVVDDEDEVPLRKEKPAVIEERQGLIEFRVFTNDGSRESMILLTGMRNLFQKQLPNMPREYIARLVYDRNHHSMAIVKAPLTVLGGIAYRLFNRRKFAEIVFFAITSTEQVKGYGSHLMNHVKDYISETTDVQHFLTYADNSAIGYFKKQGFTKEITLDRSIWMGYIKDYEGGTIMQCSMVPRVKYLEVGTLLQTQRKAVITKIMEVSKSHIIYPGLQNFKNGVKEVDPMTVPGIKESGWDPLMDTTPRVPVHGPFYNAMKHIVAELIKDASSWPFLHPVDVEAVTDYYSYIKDPMDLTTLESNVDADVYETLDDFAEDCRKIFDNCRLYNGESTPYVKFANKLEKVFKDKLKEWKEA